jgi:hypothetical protein
MRARDLSQVRMFSNLAESRPAPVSAARARSAGISDKYVSSWSTRRVHVMKEPPLRILAEIRELGKRRKRARSFMLDRSQSLIQLLPENGHRLSRNIFGQIIPLNSSI